MGNLDGSDRDWQVRRLRDLARQVEALADAVEHRLVELENDTSTIGVVRLYPDGRASLNCTLVYSAGGPPVMKIVEPL